MEMFRCSRCGLVFPISVSAFGLIELPVCNKCYEEVTETSRENQQKPSRPVPLETGQDNNPKE